MLTKKFWCLVGAQAHSERANVRKCERTGPAAGGEARQRVARRAASRAARAAD
jgi:hypothetical protein